MKFVWALPILLIGTQATVFADTILPGTQIAVRTESPIEVSRWERGRIYDARVVQDVRARDGDLAIPRGAEAELIVRQIGPREMAVDLESIRVNGRRYVVDTTGPQYHMERRDYDEGSGLVGSIVGAIAGATGARVETRGQEIRVPEGAVIRFDLQQPMHVADWADPGYSDGGHHFHRDHDWYR